MATTRRRPNLRASLLGVDPESVFQREAGTAAASPSDGGPPAVTGYDPGAFNAFASLIGMITGVPGVSGLVGKGGEMGFNSGAIPGLTITDPTTGSRVPAAVLSRLGDELPGIPSPFRNLPYNVVPLAMKPPHNEDDPPSDAPPTAPPATQFPTDLFDDPTGFTGAPPGPPGLGGANPSDSNEGGPSVMHEGGVVKDRTTAPKLAERITAQQGEFVVKRTAAAKYRRLLEAINADDAPRVRSLAARVA